MNKRTNFLCLSSLLLSATAFGMDDPDMRLIDAVWSGNLEEINKLIARGVSVDAKDDSGWTPLIWAAWSGREAVCRLLIENKAPIEAKDCRGWTTLIVAANNAKEAVCRLLIDVQLASARKNKAAIVTFLGIVRNRRQNLPCHMHYDVAKIIDRQVFGIVMQQMQPVIEQINGIIKPEQRSKWLAYVKQQINSAYDMPIDASMPKAKRAKTSYDQNN
jgi:ankyrin repeat protein